LRRVKDERLESGRRVKRERRAKEERKDSGRGVKRDRKERGRGE
jgi:hypothetical protein